MGTDIHSIAQVQVDGKWRTVAVGIGGDPRSYNMFAMLADVRKLRNLTEWFGAKRYQRGQLMRSSYRIEGGSTPSHSTARRTKKQGALDNLGLPSLAHSLPRKPDRAFDLGWFGLS